MSKHHSIWASLVVTVVVVVAGACGGAIQPVGEGLAPTPSGGGGKAGSGPAPRPDARPTPSDPPVSVPPDAATGPAPDAAVLPADATATSADVPRPLDAAADTAVAPAADAAAGAPGAWARGVRINLVEVTQSTFISLGTPEQVIAPAMRNAPVIEGRPLLVRVHTAPQAGFAPRTLRALVTLEYGDGTSGRWESTRMVSGASELDKLETTFNVLIPAAAVKPMAKLVVSVHETGPAEGGDPTPLPRFPAAGTADLAVAGGKMELDLVIMLVNGPGGPLDDSAARRKRVEDYMFDVYPVQKLNITWRPPITVARKLSGFNPAFDLIGDAREADGARDGTYYHMLLAPGDINASGGVGYLTSADADDGPSRISITVLRNRNVDGLLDYISHEVGHNHGRNHAPNCDAAGPDTKFPYPGGGLGVNGFSLSTMVLLPKAKHRDLMGYCEPTWVSDYTWRALEKRVRIVSAYPRGGVTLAQRSLQGFVAPGEIPSWGVVTGRLVPSDTAVSAERRATIHMQGGAAVVAPVGVRIASNDVTRQIAVTLPPEGVIERIELQVDGQRFSVGAEDLGKR